MSTGPEVTGFPVSLSVTVALTVTFPAVLFVTLAVVFVGRGFTSTFCVVLVALYVSSPGYTTVNSSGPTGTFTGMFTLPFLSVLPSPTLL